MRARLSFAVAALILLAVPACDSPSTSAPPPPPPQLIVTPTSASIQSGQRIQLRITARDEDGRTMTTTGVAWVATDPRVAAVGGDGVVTAREAGATKVTAWLNGISGSSTITVTPGHQSCEPPSKGSKPLFFKPACVAQ